MKGRGPADRWDATFGARAAEKEREQKDQKIGKFEDGSEQAIGAPIEVHRALPSTPLAPAPTFLIFPTFLFSLSLSFEPSAPLHAVRVGSMTVLRVSRFNSTESTY